MRGRWIQRSALVLALTAGLNVAAAPIGAQYDSGELSQLDGEGLSYEFIERGSSQGGGNKDLEQYIFTFEPEAAIPEHQYPEAMVVKVLAGQFGFRVGDEDLVIVEPRNNEIQILEDTGDPVKTSDQIVAIRPCTPLCALPPGETILIEEGSTVYLPGSVTCFWCNMMDSKAQLFVLPVIDPVIEQRVGPFSWTQMRGISGPAADAGTRHYANSTVPGLLVGCRR